MILVNMDHRKQNFFKMILFIDNPIFYNGKSIRTDDLYFNISLRSNPSTKGSKTNIYPPHIY